MRVVISIAAIFFALVLNAAEAHAWASNHGNDGPTTGGPYSSVPEPSTLYALGSGIALLGGAGWYIRRRK